MYIVEFFNKSHDYSIYQGPFLSHEKASLYANNNNAYGESFRIAELHIPILDTYTKRFKDFIWQLFKS